MVELSHSVVAPYAGAWIETEAKPGERRGCEVAPYAGAWIETLVVADGGDDRLGRSLRGSVD